MKNSHSSSLHTLGRKARSSVEDARERIAKCIGAKDKDEIIFTSSGSEANNLAVNIAKNIYTSNIEHHSMLNAVRPPQQCLQADKQGLITTSIVSRFINEKAVNKPQAISVMAVNNEVGTIQNIKEISEICHNNDIIFHTDAVQAIGHIPVDVANDNIDMLSLSAHKFHGPKGVGVLYAKKGILLTNIIEGGAQERGKRAGTENIAGIMGMTVALEDAVKNLENYTSKLLPLRDKLIEGLDKISYSELNGDKEARVPGTVNFCFEGIEGESLLLLLDAKGIAARIKELI